ncbi:MAG: cell division protein ZipA C-terminal FtsZ-binding domain-containing protein [Chromatiales bacterium]|nr:cell division protein ZipA C-terminal FtsZ-binding domain-containing protein [Chromatiales bacterium]
MEAELLRFGLILAVVGAVVALIVWDRRKRYAQVAREVHEPTLDTVPAGESAPGFGPVPQAEPSIDAPPEEAERFAAELREIGELLTELEPPSEPRMPLAGRRRAAKRKESRSQPQGESADPGMIVQISVVAPDGEQLYGLDIQAALDAEGLAFGEMQLFHRRAVDGRRVLYSAVNMVVPGVFNPDAMDRLRTPGITLFMQLPGPQDGLLTFSDMLGTAERLAARLGAQLWDQTHSVLTKQAVQFLREEIIEYGRRMQLAAAARDL